MQVDSSGHVKGPGLLSQFHNSVRTEGFKSLWKGNLASVLQKCPSGGINYYCYEVSKISLKQFWTSDRDPGIRVRFASGFIGGGVASAATYPLDIIRTRLACSSSQHPSIIRTGLELCKEGGARAFFRGLSTTLVCQSTNIAINFAIYETMSIRAIKYERDALGFFGWAPVQPDKQRGSWLTSLLCGESGIV